MWLTELDCDGLPPARIDGDDALPPDDRRRRGDGEMDALYRGQAPRLFRLFRRSRHIDAHDLVQEAFIRLTVRQRSTDEAIADPAAYLTTIATNLLRDRARSASASAEAWHLPYDDEAHGGDDPHRLLDDRDALARLNVAVGRLNRRTRQVFLLHRVEGLTYAEIAGEVGMSVKGVKKQMAKALMLLRREIGPL